MHRSHAASPRRGGEWAECTALTADVCALHSRRTRRCTARAGPGAGADPARAIPAQAAPLCGALTCSAACTTCASEASTAVGPPGMGTNQTCIMGGVTRLWDPAGQAGCPAPVTPTTPRPARRHRLVCTCHWVRQPPGCGVAPRGVVMYMAAARTAPFGVFA